MKSKQRSKMQPKMGKLGMDYQMMHEAFFKYQSKPRMTRMGDLYYEGKEFEMKVRCCACRGGDGFALRAATAAQVAMELCAHCCSCNTSGQLTFAWVLKQLSPPIPEGLANGAILSCSASSADQLLQHASGTCC